MFTNTWRYQHNIQTLIVTVRHFGYPVLNAFFESGKHYIGGAVPPDRVFEPEYYYKCREAGQRPTNGWPIASVGRKIS